jgi:hypothetical protein
VTIFNQLNLTPQITNVNVFIPANANISPLLSKKIPVLRSNILCANPLEKKLGNNSANNKINIFHSHKNSMENTRPKLTDVVVTKYSYYTKLGYLPSNPYKVNQDNFIAHPKIGQNNSRHLFAVADGHGMHLH